MSVEIWKCMARHARVVETKCCGILSERKFSSTQVFPGFHGPWTLSEGASDICAENSTLIKGEFGKSVSADLSNIPQSISYLTVTSINQRKCWTLEHICITRTCFQKRPPGDFGGAGQGIQLKKKVTKLYLGSSGGVCCNIDEVRETWLVVFEDVVKGWVITDLKCVVKLHTIQFQWPRIWKGHPISRFRAFSTAYRF